MSKGLNLILMLILFIMFCIITGCSDQRQILHIGIIAPSTNHLPLLLAIEEEIPDELNIKVHRFASGWEVNEALISGKLDLAIMPFTYAWQGVAERKRIKILSFLERESDGILVRPGIDTIEDLNGKKVGLLRASTLDIFFHLIIDELDITPEIIYFRTPTEMATALSSGHVDALSFYVPPIFQFDEQFRVLLWYSEYFPNHPCCDLVVYEDSIKFKKEQIAMLQHLLDRSCQILNEKLDRGVDLIVEKFGYERNIAQQTLQNQQFVTGLEEEGRVFQELVAGKMLELGYLRREVDPDEVYYESDQTE